MLLFPTVARLRCHYGECSDPDLSSASCVLGVLFSIVQAFITLVDLFFYVTHSISDIIKDTSKNNKHSFGSETGMSLAHRVSHIVLSHTNAH